MAESWKERALRQRSEHIAAGIEEEELLDAVERLKRKALTERVTRWIEQGRHGNGFMGRGTYGDGEGRRPGYIR